MKNPVFKTEADLCAAFNAWARGQGWTPYAETAGWDVLLVAPDGTQIGVQAKLRFNLAVLHQVVEDRYGSNTTGPDFRAVLVPEGGGETLCAALGVTLVHRTHDHRDSYRAFSPHLPGGNHGMRQDWHFSNNAKRHDLPAYIPDVVAGASAPVRLTEWKVGALRICALLELRGYITRGDFGMVGIDHRRWINESDWLRAGNAPGQFVKGSGCRFAEQHPEVYKQVRADVEKEIASRTKGPGA